MSVRGWDLTDRDRDRGVSECKICDRLARPHRETCSEECRQLLQEWRDAHGSRKKAT